MPKKAEPVEIRFFNKPSEFCEPEVLNEIYKEITSLEKSIAKKVKKISENAGVRLSVETYYRLEMEK